MASAQAQQIHDKENEALNEMVKQAKTKIANTLKPSDKVIVGGAMMNGQKEVIRLYKTHNFAGEFTTKPNEHISMDQPGFFVHMGEHYPSPRPPVITPSNAKSMLYGSSGALIYGNYVLENGQPNNTNPVCGWLLAWSVLDNRDHVYVECGSLENIMKLTWAEVENKLEKSATKSEYYDRKTGAMARASLTPDGNVAALGAVFDRKLLLN